MTLRGKALQAAVMAMLALQPVSAQDNGTATDDKPAAPEARQVTPIVTPPDQPAEAPAPDPSAPPPSPAPEEAQQQPQSAEPAVKVATFVQGQVAPILGKKVVGPDEKQVMGSIIDLLVDEEGKPRAAVLDLGGFLGVGSRHVAIDWQLLKFRASKPDAPAILNLDPADLKAAPEYKDVNAAAQVVEPSHAPPAVAPPATSVDPAPATPSADQVAPSPSVAPTPPEALPAQPSATSTSAPPPQPPANNAGQ